MRLPIRNKGDRPLTIFIEMQCDVFEIPVGGEAIVRLADGLPHSVDFQDGWVTIWDEGINASVEVIKNSDKRVDEALSLARTWLHRFGAGDEALLVDTAIERLEPIVGYFGARDQVFRAFYSGFLNDADWSSNDANLVASHRAGMAAGRFNEIARKTKMFPDLSAAPFDTDTARSAFERALSDGS
ncbi:hypothetical protein [Sphingomonas sp. HMP6]|uniref:hypothetical protein n=1 Tax=Sphingomonas sp. HMP6 TaxID=1517551 RepID=UPI0015965813|nr:hypothetical protein [Sphingomonas sp. HMP6]BCA57980.1 hypothetical protein HMP06_0749 [Sphingomonas sp. HMP6]